MLPFPENAFLVNDHKFRISPLSVHFPLVSRKLFFPHCFEKISPCFRKIPLLFTYFMCISFPPTLTMMLLCITQCTSGRPCLWYGMVSPWLSGHFLGYSPRNFVSNLKVKTTLFC